MLGLVLNMTEYHIPEYRNTLQHRSLNCKIWRTVLRSLCRVSTRSSGANILTGKLHVYCRVGYRPKDGLKTTLLQMKVCEKASELSHCRSWRMQPEPVHTRFELTIKNMFQHLGKLHKLVSSTFLMHACSIATNVRPTARACSHPPPLELYANYPINYE